MTHTSREVGPLRGLTIAITGSRRAPELAHLITSLGGRPYLAPTIGIEIKQDASKEVESFIARVVDGDVEYAVFMTGPGVYSLFSAAKSLGLERKLIDLLNRLTIVARSSKPKAALADHGVKTDIIPGENTAEGIAKVLKSVILNGKKVAVLWHGSYSPLLKTELQTVGAEVFEYSTYSYSIELARSGAQILGAMGFGYIAPDNKKVVKLIKDLGNSLIDVITFTSPPSVRNLFLIAENQEMTGSLKASLNDHAIVVAVGPPTRGAIEENGIHVDVVPEIYKMGPMLKALGDYLDRGNTPKWRLVESR